MTYNPATDFLALWRNIAGVVSKVEMPGLDYVVASLARSGLITLSVSATAPTTMQSTTAWLQTAVPSNSAEGALFLWNAVTSAYQAATAALFLDMLQASAGQNGTSWWTSTGGAPVNTVGNNGDFAVRMDEPNGIYGPKANGAWPADPIPGTADVITSTSLDNAFGAAEGAVIYRGPMVWEALEIGAENTVAVSSGGVPTWETMSALLDAVFSTAQGSLLYRDAGLWEALAPGVANQILATGGPGENPAWAPRTAEFPSGTVMLFQQTAAPVGWTKQTAINDYGLRVTSGSVGTVAGAAFSTVFAQSAVGNTTISVSQIPQHTHNLVQFSGQAGTAAGSNQLPTTQTVSETTDGGTGGGQAHTHSVNLDLSYIDVIIASKD